MRSSNYYWVKKDGEWSIAKYVIVPDMDSTWAYWEVFGHSSGCPDSFFDEIDETPITRNG